jgi:acyl-CoA dehydrogenase-like protein
LRFWVNRRIVPHALSAWRHSPSAGDWIAVAQTLIDRARQGRLPLPAAARAIPGDIASLPVIIDRDDPPQEALAAATNAKRATLLCLGAAFRCFGGSLDAEPEIMERIGKLAGLAYGIESVALRVQRIGGAGPSPEICSIHARHALADVETVSRSVLSACASGDTLRTDLALLRRLTNIEPIDGIRLRRRIADLLTARS